MMRIDFVLLLSLLYVGASVTSSQERRRTSAKQPVIIDTDIGSFLDDSFAIAYAVLSQDLDVKLVVTCTDDTTARARVAAKLLRQIGRDDIPIGIGIKNQNRTNHALFDWARNEDLSGYRGGVFQDGVGKMAELLSASDELVDIIAIGPFTNFPALVKRHPESVKKARIRAMAGSIHTGYHGAVGPVAEYNVLLCPWCMEVVLEAGWASITIAPLDTSGEFALNAGQMKQVLEANDSNASLALASTVLYYCLGDFGPELCYLQTHIPILYDVIATLLAVPKMAADFLVYSDLRLSVNGSGFTVVDGVEGVHTSVALSWKEDTENRFADTLEKLYSH